MKTPVLVFLIVALACCAFAEERKSSALFKKFPLHANLVNFYAEQQYDSSSVALFSAVQQALQHEEQEKIENIRKSVETTLTNDEVKVEKAEESEDEKSIFHNYDAEAVAIYGTADYSFLAQHLKDENYKPIFLQGGEKAIVTLWIINHKDTSLGSYKQLMVTVSVASKSLGYSLGVTYDKENSASLLFPAFGKLGSQARLFVLDSLYDREISKKFGNQITGVQTGFASASIETTKEEDSTFFNFSFNDYDGNMILQGKVEEDNSWTSYFKTGWKIFKALGLSGMLDLRSLPFVTFKTVGSKSVSSSAPKWTSMHTDMKQYFNELTNYELKLGDVGIAKLLKAMNFKADIVVRMPSLQYALTSPKDQAEDNEYTNVKELRFINEKGETIYHDDD